MTGGKEDEASEFPDVAARVLVVAGVLCGDFWVRLFVGWWGCVFDCLGFVVTRNRASAKKAGALFERVVADYLAEQLDDDRIERRVRNGNKDRGDISGVRTLTGGRIVLECKDYGGIYHVGEWLREAEIERGNDDAVAGVVVAKRRGKSDPADAVVFMSLNDFVRLVGG